MEKCYRKELGKHSPKHPHFQMGRARRSSALAICVMWHLGHPGFAFRIFPSFSPCTYSFRESGFSHGSHHPGLRLRGCVRLAPGFPADRCSPSLPFPLLVSQPGTFSSSGRGWDYVSAKLQKAGDTQHDVQLWLLCPGEAELLKGWTEKIQKNCANTRRMLKL